jgi:GNAT superfamily N-acetyltransferase
VKIRRLSGDEDCSTAILLLQRFFREEGFDTPGERIAENCLKLARLDTCGLFLAERDGKAVGVDTVSMEFGIEFGWWAEMGDLYVVPAERRRGTARRLVAEIERFLRSRGVEGYQITLTRHARSIPGLAEFYAALGFMDDGRSLLVRRVE